MPLARALVRQPLALVVGAAVERGAVDRQDQRGGELDETPPAARRDCWLTARGADGRKHRRHVLVYHWRVMVLG